MPSNSDSKTRHASRRRKIRAPCAPCTNSLVVPCAQFSGEKRHDRCTPATLLSRFGSSGLFSVSKLKFTLKGRRFDTIDEIQKNSTNELFAIPKEAFQKAFQSWQKRWERCVASEGNYFEGDKLE
jgi:hypothetical protein